jgi:hypothetical protein
MARARVVEVALRADGDVVERGGEPDHPSRAGVEPEAAENATEEDQVPGEPSAHPAARTRSRIASAGPAFHLGDVLLVLQKDPERVRHDLRVERLAVERREGGRPVERLGHARELVELGAAQLLDELRDLAREALGDPGAFARTIASSSSNEG